MKRLSLLFIFSYLLFSYAVAQTPWAKKAGNGVFTLKTFDANGSLLGSAYGFFTGEQGEAVSSFTPFKGAQRAVVIDAQGKEWPVALMIGADNTYDIAKFQVDSKKTTPLPIATTIASNGSTVWLMPYTVKKVPVCKQGTVSSAELFKGEYGYYTLAMTADEQLIGCPILNDAGQVVGLLQSSVGGKDNVSYAVSARYADELKVGALSINDPNLRTTAIPLALPDQQDEAVLSLFMAGSTMKGEQYADYLERFIQKFPLVADGYTYRARLHTAKGDFAAADVDMQQAVRVATQKDDAHYQYAQFILQKELYQSDQSYPDWSLDRALQESQEAYRLNPQPVYRQQQAEILFAQKKYAEAYDIYQELTNGAQRNAETFYAAAQCKVMMDDSKAALALLDSAVNTFSRPYIKTAAPYLRARAQLAMERRRYQQAIDDMQEVVALEPNIPDYWAEKAGYEVRLNLTDEAIKSAETCVRLSPQSSEGYLLLGLAQCIKGDKADGLRNLQQAKELGNSQAQALIDKYSQ